MKIKIFFISLFILLLSVFAIPSDKAYAQACNQCPQGFDDFWSCPVRLFADIPPEEACCRGFLSVEYSRRISCEEAKTTVNGPCGSVTNASCKTAIGTVTATPSGFVTSIFRLVLTIAGALAVLLIILSGYKLMTSQGNPDKVQAAKEQFTSAIIGLLFIVFSFVILQIIGVDILKIFE